MFAPQNYQVVVDTAERHGFGPKGYSTAVNLIVSEWAEMKRSPAILTHPTPAQEPQQ